MIQTPRTRLVPSIPTSPPSVAPRQFSLVFESVVLQALTSSERASVIAQLAILLLQAAGQAVGDDDVKR